MDPHRPPSSTVAIEHVTAGDLQRIRDVVARSAATAGLAAERGAHLVLAVSEIMTNAIQYGDGSAVVTVRIGRNRVVVEVRDSGPGIPPDAPSAPPEPDAVSGRGLWLVRQLCDEVEILPSTEGTLVRLTATAGPS
jgi:anti-sigma regulatory factor (Ser/Thr protein kinase)